MVAPPPLLPPTAVFNLTSIMSSIIGGIFSHHVLLIIVAAGFVVSAHRPFLPHKKKVMLTHSLAARARYKYTSLGRFVYNHSCR